MAEEVKGKDQDTVEFETDSFKPYDEFEVGEHKVPWFLWLFFILIVGWASIAWIQFFGY
jgi:hypothetical protein